MKILITGSKGQLGQELSNIIKSGYAELGEINPVYKKAEVIEADFDTLDISDFGAVTDLVDNTKPDIIFNCAAYTDVEGAEINKEAAYKVNSTGCLNLAIAARQINAKLVSVSTDYVFDGKKGDYYTEEDEISPLSVYGKSKLMGELSIELNHDKSFILRTAWLYGRTGSNFVKKIIELARTKDRLFAVIDQTGSPTNAQDLAFVMLELALTEHYGLYHCVNNGACSRYEFIKRIISNAGLKTEVIPVKSDFFQTKAERPIFAPLKNQRLEKLGMNYMRHWEDALDSFMQKILMEN